jgi:hypothetical protein
MQNTTDLQSLAISGVIVYSPCSNQGDDGIDGSNVGAATKLLFLFFLSAMLALATNEVTNPLNSHICMDQQPVTHACSSLPVHSQMARVAQSHMQPTM